MEIEVEMETEIDYITFDFMTWYFSLIILTASCT